MRNMEVVAIDADVAADRIAIVVTLLVRLHVCEQLLS